MSMGQPIFTYNNYFLQFTTKGNYKNILRSSALLPLLSLTKYIDYFSPYLCLTMSLCSSPHGTFVALTTRGSATRGMLLVAVVRRPAVESAITTTRQIGAPGGSNKCPVRHHPHRYKWSAHYQCLHSSILTNQINSYFEIPLFDFIGTRFVRCDSVLRIEYFYFNDWTESGVTCWKWLLQ